MNYNKWQLKAAAKGTVTSGSDWDGMTLVQVYNDLRGRGVEHKPAMELVDAIRDNRLYVQTISPYRHIGPDQTFAWLVDSGISPYAAARRVWGYSIPVDVWQAIESVSNKLLRESYQRCKQTFGVEDYPA